MCVEWWEGEVGEGNITAQQQQQQHLMARILHMLSLFKPKPTTRHKV